MPKRESRNEQREGLARQLMARYAPGVVLALYKKATAPAEGPNLTLDATSETVYWEPKEGLTTLLHEIGHHVCGVGERQLHGAGAEMLCRLLEEIDAWEWAERTAEKEGLFFDYQTADRAFASYTQAMKVPVRMHWRRR